MKTNEHSTSASDNFEENLSAPRFDEETEAAARPVVPLRSVAGANFSPGPKHVMRATSGHARSVWPLGVMLALTITVVAGVVTILVYRNASRDVPSSTPQTANETIIEAKPGPVSASTSSQPVKAVVPVTQATARQKTEPESSLTVSDEPGRHGWKDVEHRERNEEKFAERASKEEKKQLKRQRKESEKLVRHERGGENDDSPKPRLVGIYTERRKPY